MSITINYEGDTWRVIGEGTVRDGKVYCHLASTTRGTQQRNGWFPLQMGDWIDQQLILSAAIQREEAQRAITSYYDYRANSGQAALTARKP